MQQAAKTSGSETLNQVRLEDGELAYEVGDASNGFWRLVPNAAPKFTIRTDHKPVSVLTPQHACFDFTRPIQEPTSGHTQGGILDVLSGVISSDPPEAVELISLFVWISYVFPLFDELPILWLYSPSESLRQQTKDALRKLCFNGMEAKPYYLLSSVLYALQAHATTLILNDPSEYPHSFRKSLFADRDRAGSVYPFETTFVLPLFSPRIVVSHKGPDREVIGHCVAVPIRQSVRPAHADERTILHIRTGLLGTVLECLVSSIDADRAANCDASLDATFLPIYQVLRCLRDIGEVDEDFEERGRRHMSKKTQERRTKQVFLYSHDLLRGLWDFLQEPSHMPSPGGFSPLKEIADYLRGSNEMFDKITPKLLSQELNKWPALIADRKRMEGRGRYGGEVLTCVVIDRDVLENYVQ